MTAGHWVAYEAIEALLNPQEKDGAQDAQTQRWRDCKLQELNFVGITVLPPYA